MFYRETDGLRLKGFSMIILNLEKYRIFPGYYWGIDTQDLISFKIVLKSFYSKPEYFENVKLGRRAVVQTFMIKVLYIYTYLYIYIYIYICFGN